MNWTAIMLKKITELNVTLSYSILTSHTVQVSIIHWLLNSIFVVQLQTEAKYSFCTSITYHLLISWCLLHFREEFR
jgi:hypothetical protein